MKCEEVLELLMGDLDGEVDDAARAEVESHLQGCADCRREAGAYRRLHAMAESIEFAEPTDAEWRAHWTGIYNRIERGVGFILLSLGAMLLAGYGLFSLARDFLLCDDYPAILRIGVGAAAAGGIVLGVSVVRERMRVYPVDRYEEVEL
jgi:predicted anti-sigma-YlaC factor YlaD